MSRIDRLSYFWGKIAAIILISSKSLFSVDLFIFEGYVELADVSVASRVLVCGIVLVCWQALCCSYTQPVAKP